MSLLIKSVKIVDANKNFDGELDIFIENGMIKHIGYQVPCAAENVITGKGLVAISGLVDAHSHLREPGYEYKETIKTGTMAAARGGYTSVCCMPNTQPVIDSLEMMKIIKDIIKKDAVVNVYPIAAITKSQEGKELVNFELLKEAGAIAFSDDGRPVWDKLLMRKALSKVKGYDYLIIDHCEDMSLAMEGTINEGKASERLGLKGIPAGAEEVMVLRDVLLAEELDAHIHIAHISTKGSADIIRKAKQRGVKVSCEVTPHHISLSEDIIEYGYTDSKVNPPLRTKDDIQALKQALKDGTIDIIATDHAPHATIDKTEDFYKSANGISNIEASFSICNTELVIGGILTLKELVGKMSYNPSKLLGINAGKIEVGMPADITLIDIEKMIKIDKEHMISKGKNTPFHGRSYFGEIAYTLCNGKIVYDRSEAYVCR